MTRVLAALWIGIVLATAVATAQVRVVRYGDDRLAGIDEVDVLVTGGSAQDACAVDRSRLPQEIASALRERGIRATVSSKARSWFYSVVIDVRTAPISAGPCVTALHSELVAEVQAIPDADKARSPDAWGSLLVGALPLLRHNDLVIVRPLEHDAAVRSAALAHARAIASRIRSANP